MVRCIVINCCKHYYREKGLRLFRIPSFRKNECSKTKLLSARRRLFWIERINNNLQDQDIKPQTRVCSRHFIRGQAAGLFDYKNADWAPSLFMGYDQSSLDAIIQRQQLSLAEDMTRLESSHLAVTNIFTVHKKDSEIVPVEEVLKGEVQVDEELVKVKVENFSDEVDKCALDDYNENMSTDRQCLIEKVAFYKAKLEEMKDEKGQLHQELSKCEENISNLSSQVENLTKTNGALLTTVTNIILHEDTLKNDDPKVTYYCGLPSFVLLMHVFTLVSKKVPDSPLYVLPKFQQFFMVLMRLRLNLQEQDLAYRFNVSVSTVSRIFYRWLTAMSYALEHCIVWPDREILITTMPMCFKKEWNNCVAVIIDCFELSIEKSSILASAGTWSQNKHNNTVKFLLGITPQGTVSFISPAYVGDTSDKYIFEDCGVLDKLLPGDVVVADSVGFVGAQLAKPDSTDEKPQLCYDDTDLTRRIANVQIYVQRLLGLIKNKFTVLKGTLPVDFLNKRDGDEHALIDHVVQVCCALANMCSPIVPME